MKDIQLRGYEAALDYQIVRDWWERRGGEPVRAAALTTTGVFAVAEGEDVACAWLYLNNRSPVAYMEQVVIRPDCAEEQAVAAVAALADFFRQEAAKIGKLFEIAGPFQQGGRPLVLDYGGELVESRGHAFVDRLEVELHKLGEEQEMDLPLVHRFTPGMYIREIFIPAGTMLTSRIHRTEHPYVISKGDISVWTKEAGAMRLRAPYSGVTRPGTRRILYAHDDTIWTTFHATTETDVETIEEMIIEPRQNPLLRGELKEAA